MGQLEPVIPGTPRQRGGNGSTGRVSAGCSLLRCLHGTERTQPTHMPLHQYLIGAPMERIGVDILGLFPVTEARNPFVLVAMDYFRGKCGAGSECFPDGAATSG